MEISSERAAVESRPALSEQARRRDALQNRGRILAAARELFQEHGVDDVSMHQVGMAAGIGQGTLYRNFEHKGELCAALVGESAASLQNDIESTLARDDVCPLLQIDRVLCRLAAWTEESAPFIAAMVDACCGNRRTDLYQLPLYRFMQTTVVTLLTRAIAEGEIGDLDVPYTADAVLALLDINLNLYQRQELGYGRDRIVSGLRHIVFHGVAGRDLTDC